MRSMALASAVFLALLATGLASITFEETYSERLVETTEGSEILPSGSFTAKGRLRLQRGDFTMGKKTHFSLVLGNWFFERTFVAKRGVKQRFKLPGGGRVIVSCTKNLLTWSVSGKTGITDQGVELDVSPAAEDLATGDNLEITEDDGAFLGCELAWGEAYSSAELVLVGQSSARIRTDAAGDDVSLSKVVLSGRGSMQRAE